MNLKNYLIELFLPHIVIRRLRRQIREDREKQLVKRIEQLEAEIVTIRAIKPLQMHWCHFGCGHYVHHHYCGQTINITPSITYGDGINTYGGTASGTNQSFTVSNYEPTQVSEVVGDSPSYSVGTIGNPVITGLDTNGFTFEGITNRVIDDN